MSNFWEEKSLHEMNDQEWESLCDSCGKCCLNKVEDEDGAVAFTWLSCKFLDTGNCKCTDYENRTKNVPTCLKISKFNIGDIERWLPDTCAYKLLYHEIELFDWHPLVSGDPNSVHNAGISVKEKALPETDEALKNILDFLIED